MHAVARGRRRNELESVEEEKLNELSSESNSNAIVRKTHLSLEGCRLGEERVGGDINIGCLREALL